MKRSTIFMMACALLCAASNAPAFAQTATPASPAPASAPKTLYRIPFDGAWHVTAVPYVWLPNVNGSVHVVVQSIRKIDGGLPINVNPSIKPSSYLSNLNSAFMLTGENP